MSWSSSGEGKRRLEGWDGCQSWLSLDPSYWLKAVIGRAGQPMQSLIFADCANSTSVTQGDWERFTLEFLIQLFFLVNLSEFFFVFMVFQNCLFFPLLILALQGFYKGGKFVFSFKVSSVPILWCCPSDSLHWL